MKKRTSLISTALLTGIFSIACFLSCKKEEPPAPATPQPVDYTVLPPITYWGLNTFGCKINGEVWVPRIEPHDVFATDLFAGFSEHDGQGKGGIDANLFTLDGRSDWFSLSFGPTFFRTGEFHYPECSLIYWPTTGGLYIFENTDPLANKMTISVLDTARNIISGRFDFLMVNNHYPYDTLRIEDGRFDLTYEPR